MKLFNTMSMKKEEFIPHHANNVSMYVCGPTVYNYIHIGNARPIIVFDVLRRYLEYRGYDVTYVQNFTDVDDKIIRRANEEGVPCETITERYIEEYYRDSRALGVRDATVHPRATENIAEIIAIVEKLIVNGKAYESGGDVYFRTEAFPDYGKLSHQPRDALLAGARIDVSEIKENPMDFALWKSAKPGEPFWPSPWGNGRPGWHIECSAMASRYLGETIDIHCGGNDLIFPHHENEIAQSEGASGQQFVRYWLHNGFLNIDGTKMSKSLGNFTMTRDAGEAYGYENIRLFMLMSHYRSPLNYSGELLLSAKTALERIKTSYDNCKFVAENGSDGGEVTFSPNSYRERFIAALDDDMNTADAVSVVFELVREANSALIKADASKKEARAFIELFDEFNGVLGLLYGGEKKADPETEKIEALIAERAEVRAAKNWARADEIRGELSAMGISVEDTPQGAKWKRI